MSMKTPEWPCNPNWEPEEFCATWEETFHTLTESLNRLSESNPKYENWAFHEDSFLGRLMQADIDDGTYDTEE